MCCTDTSIAHAFCFSEIRVPVNVVENNLNFFFLLVLQVLSQARSDALCLPFTFRFYKANVHLLIKNEHNDFKSKTYGKKGVFITITEIIIIVTSLVNKKHINCHIDYTSAENKQTENVMLKYCCAEFPNVQKSQLCRYTHTKQNK